MSRTPKPREHNSKRSELALQRGETSFVAASDRERRECPLGFRTKNIWFANRPTDGESGLSGDVGEGRRGEEGRGSH